MQVLDYNHRNVRTVGSNLLTISAHTIPPIATLSTPNYFHK